MPNKTTNFNLDLPVGDDLFNPLWPNSNNTKIDAQMKKNQDNSVTKADCVFNADKFIITREDKTGKIFKFIAPHDFVAGYTFTVDGTAMDGIVAGTGDALAEGCFMNGHEVIAYIDETTASLAFLVGSSLPTEIDASTLGGHAVDYFATAEGLAAINQVATSAGQVANQALEKAENVKGTWNAIAFTTTMEDNGSKVFFNETLGLVYIKLSMRVLNAPGSPTLMTFPNNEFTLRTGSFSVLGISKSSSEPVSAYILTKYGSDLVIDSHPADVGWNITNPYIYATVVLGATKN